MLIAFFNREADNSFIQYISRSDILKLIIVHVLQANCDGNISISINKGC